MKNVVRNIVSDSVYPAANHLWGTTVIDITNQWYGVQINTSASSPTLTRIAGDMILHATLPIHSLIKGCLLKTDGIVNYYLNSTNWAYKTNGDASDLTGTDGFVMVEFPTFYYKVDQNTPSSGIHQIKISLYPLDGFTKVNNHYVSAYHATYDNVNLRMASVVNTTAQYRGGSPTNGTDANYDASTAPMLGRSSSYFTRTWARPKAQAIGSGWNLYSYLDRNWLAVLFMVEYATLDSQAAINDNLTAEGYKQGGLGPGVTTTTWSLWNNYFNSAGYGFTPRPLIFCGITNSLGNGTGAVTNTPPNWHNDAFAVNKYRGIEMPFGQIWTMVDGILVAVQSATAGGLSKVYISGTPSNWNDTDYSTYTYIGDNPRVSGFQTAAILGSTASIIANAVAGSNSTYYCDYFYTHSIPSSGTTLAMYCFNSGPNAASDNYTYGGLFEGTSENTPTDSKGYVGTRIRYEKP